MFFRYYLSLIYLFFSVLLFVPGAKGQQHQVDGKIKGFAFYGPKTPGLSDTSFKDIKATGANWITIVPEIILNRYTLNFQPDSLNQHWGETLDASIQAIRLARAQGLKVMLKPHMVLVKGNDYAGLYYEEEVAKAAMPEQNKLKDKTKGANWRGAFNPSNKADRNHWENNYRQYILMLAQLAEDNELDLFCIGTELKRSAIRHPEFWRALIVEVRKIYKGPITYSANWDEFDRIRFWEDLDYIGLNSYFPVNYKRKPGLIRSRYNWRKIKKRLKQISQKENRQIIFTEFGYRNVYYAGRHPWEHDEEKSIPYDKAQLHLYQAFFKAFWREEWVAGGFSWKWFAETPKPGNTTFSIQGKPAYGVVKYWYGVEE